MKSFLLLCLVAATGCGSTDSDASTKDPGFTCDLALQCQPIQAQNQTLPSSPDVTCVLESLRDRAPGRYEYTSVSSYSGVTTTLWILKDGTAVIATKTGNDVGETHETEPAHFELREPGHFDDCLSAATDQERFSCTMDNTESALTTPMSCP